MPEKQATPNSEKQEDERPHQRDTSYDTQMTTWCLESKKELITTAKSNVRKRMNKLLSVIRQQPKCSDFVLSDTEIMAMINGCCHDISAWNGVEIDSCKELKTQYRQYRTTATNWFNRNKGKIFGNNFFFPIIWKHLLNFIAHLDSVSDLDKLRLFTDVLLVIFAEDIRFARTKAQPLIPYQTVIQPNSFKSQCKHFLDAYQVQWDQTDIVPSKINRIYQKDKTRSKKIYDTFIQSLRNVRSLLADKQATDEDEDGAVSFGMYRIDAMHCVRRHAPVQRQKKQHVEAATQPPVQLQSSSGSDGGDHYYRSDSPLTVYTSNTSNTANTLQLGTLPPLPSFDLAYVNNSLSFPRNRVQANQFSLRSLSAQTPQQTTQLQPFVSWPPMSLSGPPILQMPPQQQHQQSIAADSSNVILIPLGNIQGLLNNADGYQLQVLLASGMNGYLPILTIPN